jgi:hypothetical protein
MRLPKYAWIVSMCHRNRPKDVMQDSWLVLNVFERLAGRDHHFGTRLKSLTS